MTATTFVRRIFTIDGRKETSPDEELIVFYENPRDPAVNDALQAFVEPELATERRAG